MREIEKPLWLVIAGAATVVLFVVAVTRIWPEG
jgi:hypothetical protein